MDFQASLGGTVNCQISEPLRSVFPGNMDGKKLLTMAEESMIAAAILQSGVKLANKEGADGMEGLILSTCCMGR